jgi:hypothetical protein
MIRSNPTAIPLRPSDLKHLQAELEKRKLAENPTSNSSTSPQTGNTVEEDKDKRREKDKGKDREKEQIIGRNTVEERRLERQGRSTAERIGL